MDYAWKNTLSEKDCAKANLGGVPQTFEDIIALLRNICGTSGIFLAYCVRDFLVTFSYEDDTTNYPTKDEEMVNRAPIVASADMGTDLDKTKYGPFCKDFSVDMNFLWGVLNHVFGGAEVWMHAKPSSNIKNG